MTVQGDHNVIGIVHFFIYPPPLEEGAGCRIVSHVGGILAIALGETLWFTKATYIAVCVQFY